LNPHNFETLKIVYSAANQTHFKLIVINNQTSDITAFVDFENVFGFDDMASAMLLTIGHETSGDFSSASHHVVDTMTVPDLLALSAQGIPKCIGTGRCDHLMQQPSPLLP
jgi:hypothetical protein